MIEVREVTKSFGDIIAVDYVSFGVYPGEAVGLLGANGAGKSTLIKCILGILDFSGEIELNGLNVRKKPKQAKSLLGYVPQGPVFYDMSALETLRFFGSIRGVGEERVREVLHVVGLSEHESKRTSALSGGMKQRLSFAIALLSDSPILLLDEPTSDLDAHARADFLSLIKKFKEQGKTVLFSSHRLDEVDFLSDRVLIMKSGKIILESPPEQIGERLGLRMKLNIEIPRNSINSALDVLRRKGFGSASKNGNTLSVEVTIKNKVVPLRELILSDVPVQNFTLEVPSMENIMAQVGRNGL